MPANKKKPRETFVYHKANVQNLKGDLKSFQETFLLSNPYLRSIDDNWSQFKKAVINTMLKNIPQREIKSRKYLPWLNQDIKSKMKERKNLYDKAKKTQLPEDWNAYRLTRNTVNVLATGHCPQKLLCQSIHGII